MMSTKIHNAVFEFPDWMIVPRLYYVVESELNDDLTTVGSMVTFREFKMDPLNEEVPFLWAQSLYLIARLTSKWIDIIHVYYGLKPC